MLSHVVGAALAAVVTPSPSADTFEESLQQAAQDFPDPPTWLWVSLAAVVVVVALTFALTAASTLPNLAAARRRRRASGREWVDLSTLPTDSRGVERHRDAPGTPSADDEAEPGPQRPDPGQTD